MKNLKHDDPQILKLILQEKERIENTIDLVASELTCRSRFLKKWAQC